MLSNKNTIYSYVKKYTDLIIYNSGWHYLIKTHNYCRIFSRTVFSNIFQEEFTRSVNTKKVIFSWLLSTLSSFPPSFSTPYSPPWWDWEVRFSLENICWDFCVISFLSRCNRNTAFDALGQYVTSNCRSY